MKLKLCFFGLLCFYFLNATSGYFAKYPEVVTEATDQEVIVKWKNFEKYLTEKIFKGFQAIMPRIMEASSNADQLTMSNNCSNSLFKIISALKEFQLWPIQMLDAIGKPEGGEFNGAAAMMGNYDECINIKVPGKNPKKPEILFTGQYCIVTLRPALPKRPLSDEFIHFTKGIEPLNNFSARTEGTQLFAGFAGLMYEVPLRIALCIPSSCTKEDLISITQFGSQKTGMRFGVQSCEVKTPKKLDGEQIMAISILALFALLVLTGTILDKSQSPKKVLNSDGEDLKSNIEKPAPESGIRKLFVMFSLKGNMKTLMSVKENRDKTLSCFNGMRFYSMCWVLLGHAALAVDIAYMRDIVVVQSVLESFWMQGIANGFPSVDTFFFIASVLFSYIMIKTVDKRGTRVFNIPIIFVRRVLRLLPMEFVVIIISFLLPVLGDGPFYNLYSEMTLEGCRKHWWTVAAFIQNFYTGISKEPCHIHFWYVAMDLQLFCLALIYMLILFKSAILGKLFNIFLVVASILSSFCISYYFRFPPVIHQSFPNMKATEKLFDFTYLYPHNHLIVYGCGLFLGTILARNDKIHISKPVQAVGWILSVPLGMVPVYITSIWHTTRIPYDIEGPLYISLFRLSWCLALSWVTLMCATGRGGIINDILSWKGYKPLNRPSYLVYLVHVFIMQSHYASLRGTTDVNSTTIIWGFFSLFAYSYIISTILFLFFELPISNLEGFAFSKIIKSKIASVKTKGEDSDKINNAFVTKDNNNVNEKQLIPDMNSNDVANNVDQVVEETQRTKL